MPEGKAAIPDKSRKATPLEARKYSRSPDRERGPVCFILTFLLLFAVWLLLSGKFDFFHLSLGFISTLIITVASAQLLFPEPDIKMLPFMWFRFIMYIPWLLYKVFMANIHVMRLAFHPRMMEKLNPRVIRFQSELPGDIALVTLANSITLTPGTITIYTSVYGEFTIHAIDADSGADIPKMEERTKTIFMPLS